MVNGHVLGIHGHPWRVCFSLTATPCVWVYSDELRGCARLMKLLWWKPPIDSWDLTRSRCVPRSCFASSILPPRIKARCYNDHVVQVNNHPRHVNFQETVSPRSTSRLSASKRGMEDSEHSSEFEETHALDAQPSGRFFCCYLLVSLNPARKGRTYIG